MNDTLIGLAERVRQAAAAKAILRIRGGSTKQAMAGVISDAATLDMRAYSGIVDYSPSELVITARAGTPLIEVERVLAERGQCLPFDPPRFADADGRLAGTVGGMVASGLAGPGRGDLMHFGGQVMKNVAGYDVARLTAGSWGALGAICEVSLKVLPMPVATTTLRFDMRQADALESLHAWAGQPLPLNASVWWRETLAIRLRGANAAVESAVRRLGGEVIPPAVGHAFWEGLRDQRDEFFIEAREAAERENSALWRLSLPPTTPVLPSFLDTLIEWGGAQRWIVAPAEDTLVMHRAERAGGSAFRVSGGVGDGAGYATPLAPALLAIHRRLRDSFDPHRVFVPGRPMRFQDA
jgi:glycolate oxidase FAD binding subunit